MVGKVVSSAEWGDPVWNARAIQCLPISNDMLNIGTMAIACGSSPHVSHKQEQRQTHDAPSLRCHACSSGIQQLCESFCITSPYELFPSEPHQDGWLAAPNCRVYVEHQSIQSNLARKKSRTTLADAKYLCTRRCLVHPDLICKISVSDRKCRHFRNENSLVLLRCSVKPSFGLQQLKTLHGLSGWTWKLEKVRMPSDMNLHTPSGRGSG